MKRFIREGAVGRMIRKSENLPDKCETVDADCLYADSLIEMFKHLEILERYSNILYQHVRRKSSLL